MDEAFFVCQKCKTTNELEYGDTYVYSKPIRMQEKFLEDPMLISGHSAKNLHVNNKPYPVILQNHPYIENHHEEYLDFLKRLEKEKKYLYDKHFNTDPQIKLIENYINNIEKTNYQMSYSQNEYVPIKEYLRFKEFLKMDTSNRLEFQPTIYKTNYKDLNKLHDVKNLIQTINYRPRNSRSLNEELQKIYKPGRSTYEVEVLGPAKETIKKSEPLRKSVPLDAYSDRRV